MSAHRSIVAVAAAVVALSLTACSTGAAPEGTAPPAQPVSTPAATTDWPVVPGYAPGEFPPIPLLTLPDLGLLTSQQAAFALDLDAKIGTYPGVTVEPASCDESGHVQSGTGGVVLYGDGGGVSSGPNGEVVNGGDGSGVSSTGDLNVVNGGDGSGVVTTPTVSITTDGQGSGVYTSGDLSVEVDGTGGGVLTSDDESLTIEPDGSGVYSSGDVSIINEGNGAGQYSDTAISIINNGDGTGLIDGESVDFEMPPLAPVPNVGTFPTMAAVAPIESCGTVISLDSEVLFDFDVAELRPDAQTVMTSLSTALTDVGAPTAEIGGHTDSIGDDAYNLDLSERRASAVVAALQELGTPTTCTAVGYGESRPVAANENADGTDNPGGRAENRRVEIFVPAF